MDNLELTVDVGTSNDAELQAIRGIPQLMRDLHPERKKGVLRYLLERVESGDSFGEDHWILKDG